jgi:hypothetical protein
MSPPTTRLRRDECAEPDPAVASYDNDDFNRLIREGVPRDGRTFWFMPVEAFQFLSDADLAALLAYLRTFKPAGTQLPPIKKGKGFQEDFERGFLDAREQIARYRTRPPADMGAQRNGAVPGEDDLHGLPQQRIVGYEDSRRTSTLPGHIRLRS